MTDFADLPAAELADLLHLARERDRRWARLADPFAPTIGAVRRREAIPAASPVKPIPLDRLRRLAIEMAPSGPTAAVGRAILELAVESGVDVDSAVKAITAGLRQARQPRRRRRRTT